MARRKRLTLLLVCVAWGVGATTFTWAISADDGPRATAATAREILNRRCFACHGANGVARKNVFVLDRDRLVTTRTVVPNDSTSLLLRLVESGEMPMGGPELTSAEKEALRNWIVSGAPGWDEPAEPKRKFLTEPEILALIRNDLLQSRERNRPFLRYFSLSNLYNAGLPSTELDISRAALSKLVNSLSWHREVTPLVPIDPAKTIFRVDLRDYNWTAATWNLLFAVYPYGVRGSESRLIDQLSGASLPYIRADWFVATASVPPLYHDILGLPKTVRELEQQLGIDAARDLEEEKNVARAGLRSSGVSSNNRVLERHASPHGAYWKSFDFRSNLDDQNIFRDPLRLNPAGGEIIFNLPNGYQAYFLADAFGRRIDEAPIPIVADRNNPDDPVIRNGRSCMSCHYDGIQGFKDDVRAVVRGLSFSSFDREKALAIYPAQETLDQLIARDRRRFERAAEQLGPLSISVQTEPINASTRRFLSEMSVAQAAAEAGLETVQFQARVANSPRLLGVGYGQLLVAGGGIKRDAWDKNFGALVRELGLGDHVASVIILPGRATPGATNAANFSGAGIRSTARAVGADPVAIMRSARTIHVRSMTVYLEAQQFENELLKRPEFKSLELAIVKDPRMADIRIEINRAEFSFNYAFTATNPQTSMVVASGKVTAWNGHFAAPRIAKDFLKQMEAARGIQESR
jgi:mono/diheme cytochrome c family protein